MRNHTVWQDLGLWKREGLEKIKDTYRPLIQNSLSNTSYYSWGKLWKFDISPWRCVIYWHILIYWSCTHRIICIQGWKPNLDPFSLGLPGDPLGCVLSRASLTAIQDLQAGLQHLPFRKNVCDYGKWQTNTTKKETENVQGVDMVS